MPDRQRPRAPAEPRATAAVGARQRDRVDAARRHAMPEHRDTLATALFGKDREVRAAGIDGDEDVRAVVAALSGARTRAQSKDLAGAVVNARTAAAF